MPSMDVCSKVGIFDAIVLNRPQYSVEPKVEVVLGFEMGPERFMGFDVPDALDREQLLTIATCLG